MAYTTYASVTATGFQWMIYGLGNPFNTTYYIKAVLCTSDYGGSTSSLSYISSINAPTSNNSNSTTWVSATYNGAGTTKTFYGYAQAANGIYYACGSCTITFPVAVPNKPTGLSLDTPIWDDYYGYYKCRLNWNSVSGATYYEIYKNGSYQADTYATTHLFSGLSPNTNYTFGVAAGNSAGTSALATISKRMPSIPDTIAPKIHSFSITTVTKTSIGCSWHITDSGGSGLDIISLGLYNYSTSSWVWVHPSISSTNYTFTGLTPNTKYELAINATDGAGNTSSTSYIDNVWTLSDTFQWSLAKVSGQAFNVTASEWTNFQNAINDKRNRHGLSSYNFTTVYKNSTELSAAIFNQPITCINQIYSKLGQSTQISPYISGGVAKGDTVYAWYFNNIRDALNNT